MTNSIYHHKDVPLATPYVDLNGRAHVYLHASGTVTVQMTAALGAMYSSISMDAPSLRAFAALLNEAVEKLPAEQEAA